MISNNWISNEPRSKFKEFSQETTQNRASFSFSLRTIQKTFNHHFNSFKRNTIQTKEQKNKFQNIHRSIHIIVFSLSRLISWRKATQKDYSQKSIRNERFAFSFLKMKSWESRRWRSSVFLTLREKFTPRRRRKSSVSAHGSQEG